MNTPRPLTVHRIKDHSMVLGPGRRCVIWFHGCSLDCPGCIAYEMNRSLNAREYSPEELCQRVLSIDEIEGVTLSGGDPLDQPLAELLQFTKLLKAESDLSVMCYTGRTMDELVEKRDPVIVEFLVHCDLLIDGRYEQNLNDGAKWRGSSNQKVWHLSSRYDHLCDTIETQSQREIEIEIGSGNELTIAGIPPQGFMRKLHQNLASRGMQLRGRT